MSTYWNADVHIMDISICLPVSLYCLWFVCTWCHENTLSWDALCPYMEISVSVCLHPFYAHIWRSLYLSVCVPFMPVYGDLCDSASIVCPYMPYMEISVYLRPFYAHIWDLCRFLFVSSLSRIRSLLKSASFKSSSQSHALSLVLCLSLSLLFSFLERTPWMPHPLMQTPIYLLS